MTGSWTYQEIENDWLAGDHLAVTSEVVVEAFNCTDRILGKEWIEASRTYSGGLVRGGGPTLQIVTMGQQLAAIEDIPNHLRLIDKIRRGDQSAVAELTAFYLLRHHLPEAQAELFPTFEFDSRVREADFRIRRGNECWNYVEVTQSDYSDARTHATSILNQITKLAAGINMGFVLEVYLSREPSDEDMDTVLSRLPEFCNLDGPHQEELPSDLGILALNPSLAGSLAYAGPSVLLATVIGRDGLIRHITVRMSFSDDRGAAFLQNESRQLPGDAPGLVMMQVGEAPGAMRSWEPLLLQQFRLGRSAWVSAVCLFSSAINLTKYGPAWLPESNLILNPHGRLPLPFWMEDALKDAKNQFVQGLG